MGTILIIGSVFLGILFLFSPLHRKRNLENNWGLGVDCCFYYSKPFSVGNNRITIIGFQEVLGKGNQIQYSLVKKNWCGKRIVYGQASIPENYIPPNQFQITFCEIPSGSNYQVEVFNGYRMAYGNFKVLQGNEESLIFHSNPVSKTS